MPTKLSSLIGWLQEYQVLSRYRKQWFLAALFLVLAATATLAVPLAFRGLVDAGITSEGSDLKFTYLLALAIVLAVVTASRFYMMSWLGERVVADIRQRVFKNVLRQSPVYFETLQTGEVLSRLTSDTTVIQTLVGSSISIALRSTLMLVGGMAMMLVTSVWLASVMIVLLLLIVLPLWAMGRRVRKMSRASQDKVADTSAMAGEVLNAVTTVQAFVREAYEQKRFNAAVEAAFGEAKKRIAARSLLTVLTITMAFAVIVFVLWMGARQVTAGAMTIGELTQFVLYAVFIAGSIGALSETFGDVQRAAGAMERLVELMQDSPQLANKVQPHLSFVLGSKDAIVLKDVTFTYPSRPDFLAMHQVSFVVPQGARYALVGALGAGKSTLFSLLLRFYEPGSGQIEIFGRDITRGLWTTCATASVSFRKSL
jgi:ATP-binding cassette subfamily B protein